jgi:hypothetical protein
MALPVAMDHTKRRDMRSEDLRIIFYSCRAAMVNGVLRPGIQKELANQLGFEKKSISKQWRKMSDKLAPLLYNRAEEDHLEIIQDNAHILFATGHGDRRKGKFKWDRVVLGEMVKGVPLKSRRTVWNLAGTVDIPKSTIQSFLKPISQKRNNANKVLVRHTSNLRPTLTATNKRARFDFCISQINNGTLHLRHPKYCAQYDKVHIDEKWFYLTQDGERYILAPGEEPPKRHVKHKNFILKVMFLCAQARPRYDHSAQRMWDGKLGIWPIGNYTIAQRNSVNRPAGTQEWKNDTFDREAYKELLKEKVFQAIIEKWPAGEWADNNFVIKVQQDGAGGHCDHDDPDITEYLQSVFLNEKIELYTQPANSPDLNLLDLGLFNAIQAAYWKHSPRTHVQLIAMVQATYEEFPISTINRVWLSLMTCFNEVIALNGDNTYKVPHMNKSRLERLGLLPDTIDVSDKALEVAGLRRTCISYCCYCQSLAFTTPNSLAKFTLFV